MADRRITDIKNMVSDMEAVEGLLVNKGRFVGDMVHISIADLAEIARSLPTECAVTDEQRAGAWGDMPFYEEPDHPFIKDDVAAWFQKHHVAIRAALKSAPDTLGEDELVRIVTSTNPYRINWTIREVIRAFANAGVLGVKS